jgi:hypothetical protein
VSCVEAGGTSVLWLLGESADRGVDDDEHFQWSASLGITNSTEPQVLDNDHYNCEINVS